MADNENNEDKEPVIRDKRRIDPETGDVREPASTSGEPDDTGSPEGADATEPTGDEAATEELSAEDQAILDEAQRDLVEEMRNDMLRAQAELVNFRARVERDRAANREAVIAEVFRSFLPVVDDLTRAEAHGDLEEGGPLTLVAQKLRSAFDKFGLKPVGEKGEPFDPTYHEAVVQLPSPDVTENTIADVIEVGYVLGDRVIRPAKVAVSVPAE